MNEITLNNHQIKEIFKQAIREIICEDRELFSELLTEIIEDIGLVNAIKEAENSNKVSRETIFNILNSNYES